MNIKTPTFELAIYQRGDGEADKLALCLPGRLDTKDHAHMRSHVDFLAGKGYFALSFDPPGTWESPGDISLYTIPNYLKAVNEIIEYYGNRPTTALGHSRGGSMAILAGINNSYVTHFISVMSWYTGLETCKKPKLFFLGRSDDVVLPEDVRSAYECAVEPKQLHELESDHDYRHHPKIIAEVEKVIGEFLGAP